MIVHAMMSLDVSLKTLAAFTQVYRAFLWKGHREVNGGHCLVAWEEVTSPKCFRFTSVDDEDDVADGAELMK
jgi:hypothetical protein